MEREYGPVPVSDERAPWASAPTDPEVSNDEFDRFFDGLHDVIEAVLERRGVPTHGGLSAAYARGDNFGERTEEVYVYPECFVEHADALTDVVFAIADYVARPEHERWRVAVIIADGPDGVLLVYPSAFFGREEVSRDRVPLVVSRLLMEAAAEESREAAAKRQALADVKPHALAALQSMAHRDRLAHAVTQVDDDGDFYVWVIQRGGLPSDLEVSPDDLGYHGEFIVRENGELVESDGENWHPNDTLLVQWLAGAQRAGTELTFRLGGDEVVVPLPDED